MTRSAFIAMHSAHANYLEEIFLELLDALDDLSLDQAKKVLDDINERTQHFLSAVI